VNGFISIKFEKMTSVMGRHMAGRGKVSFNIIIVFLCL